MSETENFSTVEDAVGPTTNGAEVSDQDDQKEPIEADATISQPARRPKARANKRKARKRVAKKRTVAKKQTTREAGSSRVQRSFPASSFEDAMELALTMQRMGATKVRRLTLFEEFRTFTGERTEQAARYQLFPVWSHDRWRTSRVHRTDRRWKPGNEPGNAATPTGWRSISARH